MPRLLVFAGPNGSGKSTVTQRFGIVGKYVNADEIKKALDCTDMDAAVIAERTRETLLNSKSDFSFETVLSTERNLKLIAKAKQNGYYVTCIYVLTSHPDINLKRVESRVRNGGAMSFGCLITLLINVKAIPVCYSRKSGKAWNCFLTTFGVKKCSKAYSTDHTRMITSNNP